jgi:hypothetical protein
MDRSSQEYRWHLFTVRIWREEVGDGQAEWRGQVQHVQSKEVRYFREWATLVAAILNILCACQPPPEAN